MTFTDDDLSLLKDNIHEPHEGCSAVQELLNERMLALLARLEAAEKVIAICEAIPRKMLVLINSRVKAWRKAAGKQ